MAFEITLPVHDGADNGEVARWLVKVGDQVAARQPLVAVDFDGSTIEIRSTRAGQVARICADVGACVRTGSLLALID